MLSSPCSPSVISTMILCRGTVLTFHLLVSCVRISDMLLCPLVLRVGPSIRFVRSKHIQALAECRLCRLALMLLMSRSCYSCSMAIANLIPGDESLYYYMLWRSTTHMGHIPDTSSQLILSRTQSWCLCLRSSAWRDRLGGL